jgi:hypothetical protein
MKQQFVSRRSLLRTLVLSVPAGLVATQTLRADELPKLATSDPAAAALGYVEDAAQVDTKKFPVYIKGSNCDNCLQLQGKAGNNYRPCSLFPGKLVATRGWCSSWTVEM